MPNDRLVEKMIIKFDLELLSGMRIGGNDPGIAIGAIDSNVIRDPLTFEPYIPGSSLKGKLRSLIERLTGAYNIDKEGNAGPSMEFASFDSVKMFGLGAKESSKLKDTVATRLIVRDAFLTDESREKLRNPLIEKYLDSPYAEVKTETAIDRIKGSAKDGTLRFIERVPKGVSFKCEIVLSIWASDSSLRDNYIAVLRICLQLLGIDYIGGSGSRGYGHVKVNPDIEGTKTIKFLDSGEYKEDQLCWDKDLRFQPLSDASGQHPKQLPSQK